MRHGLAFLILVWGTAQAAEPVNPNLNPTTRAVWDYLQGVYGRCCLAGYNVYVHTPDDYEQTGKQAAVWSRDIRWLGDTQEVIAHARSHGYLLSLHWHWFFGGDSAWTSKRKAPVDVGRVVTPGTAENATLMTELAAAADTLQLLEDADIPVLWRPLHEIDGGWFWWTDKAHPEHTAQLWRLMFDYFTHTRKLDNLIWVYSAGVGKKTLAFRQACYPGAAYVDISGIDIYGVEVGRDVAPYWDYWNLMSEVSPGKMLACGECDAIPDPNRMADGSLPRWLYALPWWGAPSARRSVAWATTTMRHDFVRTLEDLPAWPGTDLPPHVNLLEPRDDGTAWYPAGDPSLCAEAVDRDGSMAEVAFYADDQRIGTVTTAPYRLTWRNPTTGSFDVTAVATDDAGHTRRSNRVRITVGLTDAARGRPVTASSGDHPERAVDGDYHTAWVPDKGETAWLVVDLGRVTTVDQVNLHWGWKIHAADFALDLATADPTAPASWTEVRRVTGRPYQTWEAVDRLTVDPRPARYLRLRALRRAGNQTWGAYQLMALEVPVAPRQGRAP